MEKNVPKLRFKEFTGEWEVKKLEDIVEFLDGRRKPIEKSVRQDMKGIYPYYGASGIIDYVNDYIFDEELILLGEDGANILNRNTKLCFLASGKYWVNNHAHVMRSKNENNNYFISESLEKKDYSVFNTGTAQPKLNQAICRSISLCTPSPQEQERIADFLTTIDSRITNQSAKVDSLTELKKGIMQKIFSQEIRFKREDGGEYPDWEKKKLKEVASIYDGTHQTPTYVSKGIRFLSVENIKNFKASNKFITHEDFERDFKIRPEKGDILMTRIGDIGTPNIVNSDEQYVYYVSLALIKSKKITGKFLLHAIQSPDFQRELFKRTLHIAFPKKINKGEIGVCPINFPTIPEQQKIADFLSTIDSKIDLETRILSTLQTLKKGLLQQMFV